MRVPRISVIVPVFNAERDICRCIDSLLVQTFSDFELLIIDDGSTDDSLSICNKYATMDERIRVYHKENGGVSSARNLGIKHSIGEWVLFCDSDDTVLETYLENMFSDINEADFVVSKYDETIGVQLNSDGLIVGDCIGAYVKRITDFFTWSVPWGKMYRRSVLSDYKIKFDERIYSGEDSIFVLEYIKSVNNIFVKGPCGYCHKKYNGLSMRKMPFDDIDMVVEGIISNLQAVETKYNVDLSQWKINSIWNFIAKYKIPQSFKYLYDDVKRFSSKRYMLTIVQDGEFVPKGKYRKLFDILYLHRMNLLLATMIYISGRFYN